MTRRSNVSKIDRAERVYRRLLWLYPRAFRDRFENDAAEVFRDRYRHVHTHQGRFGILRLWLITVLNVTVHGARERMGITPLGDVPQSHGMNGLRGELVRAFQSTWRSRRLNIAAIACIALGVSAVGAVLTLYSSVVLRPLPFPDHDRLVRIWNDNRGVDRRTQLSFPDVAELREQISSLDAFAATSRSRFMFYLDPGARRVEGEGVTPGYFELLGVQAFVGRAFTVDDHRRDAPPTMILSFATWNGVYGADPDILDSIVRTASGDYTVIGVMPPDFIGTIEHDFPDIEYWVPIDHDITEAERTRRTQWFIWTIGRLAPGVTLAQAQAEVDEIGARWSETYPVERGSLGLRLEPMGENWREDARRQNNLLVGAVGLLLFIASTNVAGLLIARTLNRTRELAVRAALGASRRQLVRLMFLESTALTVIGSAIGLLAAPSVLATFLRLAPDEIPGYVAVQPDAIFMMLAIGVVALTSLVAGTAPAILSARTNPGDVLRGWGRGGSASGAERRWGRWLVAGEVALTTVLIFTAVLMTRSFQAMSAQDLGYRTENLLGLAVFVDERDLEDIEAMPAFHDRLRESLSSFPGVRQVGLLWPALPPGFAAPLRIRFAGLPEDQREHGLPIARYAIDPSLLSTLDIKIVEGRDFTTADDDESRPVAIISESVARLMGGSESALGRMFEQGRQEYEVVGVTEDVMWEGAVRRRDRDFDVFFSIDQQPRRVISIAVHTAGDPSNFIAPLRARLLDIAPSSAHDWINPVTTGLAGHFESPRFYVVLLGSFAASALLLTAVGLFAVLSNQVARHTRDIGIRTALGAGRFRIVHDVVGSGLGLTAAGLFVGGASAIVVARGIRTMLYEVGSLDVVTWAATGFLLLFVAAFASYIPAARAAKINPIQALSGD